MAAMPLMRLACWAFVCNLQVADHNDMYIALLTCSLHILPPRLDGPDVSHAVAGPPRCTVIVTLWSVQCARRDEPVVRGREAERHGAKPTALSAGLPSSEAKTSDES